MGRSVPAPFACPRPPLPTLPQLCLLSLGSARAGEIVSAEPVGGKDKLTQVEVNVGGEDPLRIVTNAPNAKQGNRVVVATIGATVGDVVVKKASVGGAPSEGMLCDCPMLGASHGRPADKIFALRWPVFCRRGEGRRRGGRCAGSTAVCETKTWCFAWRRWA